MLSRLASAVLTLDGTRLSEDDNGMKSVPEDEALMLDMESFRALIPMPDRGTWWRVAGMCGQVISPVYHGIQGMLAEDIETVAMVLSQAGAQEEPNFGEPRSTTPAILSSGPTHEAANQLPERPRRKRRRSSNVDHHIPLVIPSSHPSTPTIIITPCTQEPPLTSGHVPYQDNAHGSKLTVPLHPTFNSFFPPMAPSQSLLPPVSRWKWIDGHWQAILPDLDEQAKRGMYSRPLTASFQNAATSPQPKTHYIYLSTYRYALVYAYILGGLTFIPLAIVAAIFFTIYTSVPVGDPDPAKAKRNSLAAEGVQHEDAPQAVDEDGHSSDVPASDVNDIPKTRKGWLTMRKTFEESNGDGSYVTLVRSFLDSRSKDPKRSRPRDMWYVVLKGNVLYLYEDEAMTECGAAIELSGFEAIIFPEGQLDGELFAKRNAICLQAKLSTPQEATPSLVKQPISESVDIDGKSDVTSGEKTSDGEKGGEAVKEDGVPKDSWFIFARTNVEMEDWYFALIHASEQPAFSPTLTPLHAVFSPTDMNRLVTTLDEQPDVIPMRWLNALIGRIFFSYYRTHALEAYIIGRLMKKLSKVKRPGFLSDVVVREVSVGNRPPTLSKPMLKELTKEGDASLEVHLQYKGEIRITIETTATINLGARFKPYNVKLVLAAVLKEIEGNLLVKVKRPPSNRIWYAFTQAPRMVLAVEPIVSDRQITWTMILSTIEARLKEIIQESIVMPNMDDIAFFESSPYAHRGGIWSDASRHNVPSPSLFTQDPAPSETLSTVSAPAMMNDPSTESTSSSSKDTTTPIPPEIANVQSVPTITPSSELDSSSSSGSNTMNRRRTWFSGLRSDELSDLIQQDPATPSTSAQDQTLSKPELAASQTLRSVSQQSKDATVPSTDDDLEVQKHLSPAPSRPTSRQSNHKKALSVSSDGSEVSAYTDGSAISAVSSRNAESTSASSRGSNLPSTPASPTSFLSQLKQRAPDKQVLSNTAKEAMKKWGMNWANLRKDANKEREQNGDTSGEDLPDHGSIGSRIFDPNGSVAQRARQSYAEVRAAVAERRDKSKEADSHGVQGSSGSGFLRADIGSTSSNPILIPDNGKTRARVISAPGLGIPTSSSRPSLGEQEPVSRRPSQSSETSNKSLSASSTSAPSASVIADLEDEAVNPPSPIHKQPQAMMMTIPGIHASHRGDVMSMGYVAPEPHTSPSPSRNDKEGAGSRIKLPQNPTIQSVYSRFWKSPGPVGDMGNSPSGSTSAQTAAQGSSDIDPSTPRSNTPSPPTVPTRNPPPLPPRSTPTAISGAANDPSPSSLSIQSNDSTTQNSPPTLPSASDTLKNIVSKDDNNRMKRASQDPLSQSTSSRPPSRRVSANYSDVSTLNSYDGDISKASVDADGGLNHESHDINNDTNLAEDSLLTPTPPSQVFRPSNPGPPLPPRRVAAPES
ncbi:hypothetical protein ONZ45_g8622 [Pleurotus djamor]|nr:hypothetical protein ONZ45_g8622 [Pleurotus djamor]